MTIETIDEILTDMLTAVLDGIDPSGPLNDLADATNNPTLAYGLLMKYREVKYLEDRVRECATPGPQHPLVVRIDDLIAAMEAKRQL